MQSILDHWKANGVTLVVKEQFPREFVHEQVKARLR